MDEIDQQEARLPCRDCDGKGYFIESEALAAHDCPTCNGTGAVSA